MVMEANPDSVSTATRPDDPPQWGALYYAVVIFLSYMLIRSQIIALHWGSGTQAFLQYDRWMSVPRMMGFLACAVVILLNGGFRHWGWSTKYSGRGLLLLALSFMGFIFIWFSGRRTFEFQSSALFIFWLTTIPVALFEESCFRGLIYLSLRQRYGAIMSALASSLMFMLFHWQAQPFHSWPDIFVYGVAACGALELGTGLIWIALIHEIIDSLYFQFESTGLDRPSFLLAGILINLALLGLTIWWIRSKPPTLKSAG